MGGLPPPPLSPSASPPPLNILQRTLIVAGTSDPWRGKLKKGGPLLPLQPFLLSSHEWGEGKKALKTLRAEQTKK